MQVSNVGKSSKLDDIWLMILKTIFILSLTAVLSLPSIAQDRIAVYGIVSVVAGDLSELNFVIYGKELEARRVEISKKGKFYFTVPVGKVAFIRCSKPGYLTKRVKIDTHHAFVTKENAKYNKSVDFDLEMIPQAYKTEMNYKGPVATISFDERSGLLKMAYNYEKSKAEDEKKPKDMESQK